MSIDQVVSSGFDSRDYKIKSSKELPEKFSCSVKVPIKNQGSKPTCVAHACASVAEYHHKRQHDNNYVAFSTEFVYGYRPSGYYYGRGMRIRDALKTLQKVGIPRRTDCPGNNELDVANKTVQDNFEQLAELAYPNRISAYYKLNSVEEMKTAIVNHGPILVSMNTYHHAELVDDIYTFDPEDTHGHHCVFVYGYDERGWLVQNSWGANYAGDGRFVYAYTTDFNEAWGVTDDIVNSDDIILPSKNPLMLLMYKLCNVIANVWLHLTDKT